jgi:hypothetical protein
MLLRRHRQVAGNLLLWKCKILFSTIYVDKFVGNLGRSRQTLLNYWGFVALLKSGSDCERLYKQQLEKFSQSQIGGWLPGAGGTPVCV